MSAPSAGGPREDRARTPPRGVPQLPSCQPGPHACALARARTVPTWRRDQAFSALSKASSPRLREKATKYVPPSPQIHAVPSRRYTPSTEKPLLPPAAVRLLSRPTHSRTPRASLSLCGAISVGAGPPPLPGGCRPTVWREALLRAMCVRACVRVLRRVRVSEARAQGSSWQGRAERGMAGQEAQQDTAQG